MEEEFMIKMPVLEMFTTLNGEGQFSGKPVVFVRLVGCNIRCKYGASGTCDTPESLLFPHERPVKDWEDLTAKEIGEYVKQSGVKHVTLTGGNPCSRPNIGKFIMELAEEFGEDVHIEIEENGSVDIKRVVLDHLTDEVRKRVHFTLDYKCISSFVNKLMIMDNWNYLNETDVIKCVVADKVDMDDAVAKYREIKPLAPLYFSPMFGVTDLQELWEYAYQPEVVDLNIRVQYQLHKLFYDPTVKGV